MTEQSRYLAPGWFTRHVFNRSVRAVTRLGLSVMGSRELRVRGRKSGEWRSTPVNLLSYDGDRYLMAPRGTTQWVLNLRATDQGELRLGRRVERFRGVEIADSDKVPMMREYIRRWSWEVGAFLEGLDKNSTDEQLLAAAPGFPVFRVDAAAH